MLSHHHYTFLLRHSVTCWSWCLTIVIMADVLFDFTFPWMLFLECSSLSWGCMNKQQKHASSQNLSLECFIWDETNTENKFQNHLGWIFIIFWGDYMTQSRKKSKNTRTQFPTWLFQTFFIFTLTWGNYSQFHEHIFQMGLVQPPTSTVPIWLSRCYWIRAFNSFRSWYRIPEAVGWGGEYRLREGIPCCARYFTFISLIIAGGICIYNTHRVRFN